MQFLCRILFFCLAATVTAVPILEERAGGICSAVDKIVFQILSASKLTSYCSSFLHIQTSTISATTTTVPVSTIVTTTTSAVEIPVTTTTTAIVTETATITETSNAPPTTTTTTALSTEFTVTSTIVQTVTVTEVVALPVKLKARATTANPPNVLKGVASSVISKACNCLITSRPTTTATLTLTSTSLVTNTITTSTPMTIVASTQTDITTTTLTEQATTTIFTTITLTETLTITSTTATLPVTATATTTTTTLFTPRCASPTQTFALQIAPNAAAGPYGGGYLTESLGNPNLGNYVLYPQPNILAAQSFYLSGGALLDPAGRFFAAGGRSLQVALYSDADAAKAGYAKVTGCKSTAAGVFSCVSGGLDNFWIHNYGAAPAFKVLIWGGFADNGYYDIPGGDPASGDTPMLTINVVPLCTL